jgi:hypothetical protein
LGYDDDVITELKARLTSCEDSIFSPFTLIKGFLEVERKRRFKIVNDKIQKLQSILLNNGPIPIGGEDVNPGDPENLYLNVQDPKNIVRLYVEVYQLTNQLTAWKIQIARFVDHEEDFKGPRY